MHGPDSQSTSVLGMTVADDHTHDGDEQKNHSYTSGEGDKDGLKGGVL